MNLQGMTLYLVYGWKIDEPFLSRFFMNVPDSFQELGIKLVMPKDQKYGFAGKVLGFSEDEASDLMAACPPMDDLADVMRNELRKVGISVGEPKLCVVLG